MVIRETFSVRELNLGVFVSFEYLAIRCALDPVSAVTILLICRPLGGAGTFLGEISTLITIILCSSSNLVIMGDFNLWLEDSTNYEAQDFITELHCLNISLHSTGSTHQGGHCLDAIFSHNIEVTEVSVQHQSGTDHALLAFELPQFSASRVRPRNVIVDKYIFRDFKNLAVEQFDLVYPRLPTLQEETMDPGPSPV